MTPLLLHALLQVPVFDCCPCTYCSVAVMMLSTLPRSCSLSPRLSTIGIVQREKQSVSAWT